jgi:hypothetical protein
MASSATKELSNNFYNEHRLARREAEASGERGINGQEDDGGKRSSRRQGTDSFQLK